MSILSRQSTNVFGQRINVPGESVAERLSSALDYINVTAANWYDGSIESIDHRMDLVRQTMMLARQAHGDPEVTAASLSAIEIDNSLERLYSMLAEAREQLALTEVDLPQFSINASPA